MNVDFLFVKDGVFDFNHGIATLLPKARVQRLSVS